ncbi:MAG: helix-turn-helix domain-containing protein [Rhodobacterales bacterium]
MWTSSITAEQIGEALRRTRKAGGWTQSDISAHTNLRVATISSLENGDAGTGCAPGCGVNSKVARAEWSHA